MSELYAKSGQPKMARLTFSMTGQWLIGGTMEQETAINAMVDAKTVHPHQQTIKDGQTYVTLERLIGGSLRAAGWVRLPGKAPVVDQPAVEGVEGGVMHLDVVQQKAFHGDAQRREEQRLVDAFCVHPFQPHLAVAVFGADALERAKGSR